MTGKDCAHASCSCSVGPEQDYCSSECSSMAETPGEEQAPCRCGHADCMGFAGASGEEGVTGGAAKDWDEAREPTSGPRRASG